MKPSLLLLASHALTALLAVPLSANNSPVCDSVVAALCPADSLAQIEISFEAPAPGMDILPKLRAGYGDSEENKTFSRSLVQLWVLGFRIRVLFHPTVGASPRVVKTPLPESTETTAEPAIKFQPGTASSAIPRTHRGLR